MPLVHLHVCDDTQPPRRRAIADAVHDALVAVAGVPRGERFQLVSTRPRADVIVDARFAEAERRDPVLVEITLVRDELDDAAKGRLFAAIAAALAGAGVRGDDVFVVLVENGRGDWAAAHGIPHLTGDPR